MALPNSISLEANAREKLDGSFSPLDQLRNEIEGNVCWGSEKSDVCQEKLLHFIGFQVFLGNLKGVNSPGSEEESTAKGKKSSMEQKKKSP